ncbi:hypothetical protein PAE9249_01353 [Paenibacillus sp. CECT 9249]|uniref:amidase domain-containing protein n=1 Tax=Paenibacillus sp. CECT 9249 TaxID=2845385 RepID=UPI001E42620A|nr:amidase domain-containing protein [Paenibacillus sp. CECT 9249]CAH0118856.1 hypothetical protein PAE9249_01353 [Paenibacillus sp. CECT 9249]
MQREWKNTLYMYVNQYNRSEVDYRPQAVNPIVTDLDHVMRKSERMQLLERWYRERASVPLRSETRTKLLRTREGDGEVVVDLEFHIRRYYEKRNITHMEERLERERLTLSRDGQAWLVTRVETAVPERHPVMVHAPSIAEPAAAELQEEPLKAQSVPYLNMDVLGFAKSSRAIPYYRQRAVQYADQWWNEPNPDFLTFEVDCTNFVSQCLFAGGAPIYYTGRRESGWWYKGRINGREEWSFSWAVSNSLQAYLSTSRTHLRAEAVSGPEELQLGDVILYDWDGNGHYQHSVIVTAFDAGGMPLVNARTTSSRHRYWDYRDSYAWTDQTKYRFFHIADQF